MVAQVPLLGRIGLSTGRARLVGEAQYRQLGAKCGTDQSESNWTPARGEYARGVRAPAPRQSVGFMAARDCLHGARVSGD